MKRLLWIGVLGLAMVTSADSQNVVILGQPDSPPKDEVFSVEQLTDAEVKAIQVAEKEFAEAEAKHDSTLNQVRVSHGQTQNRWGVASGGFGFTACGAVITQVELRGKYALISKTKDNSSCPVMAAR